MYRQVSDTCTFSFSFSSQHTSHNSCMTLCGRGFPVWQLHGWYETWLELLTHASLETWTSPSKHHLTWDHYPKMPANSPAVVQMEKSNEQLNGTVQVDCNVHIFVLASITKINVWSGGSRDILASEESQVKSADLVGGPKHRFRVWWRYVQRQANNSVHIIINFSSRRERLSPMLSMTRKK